MSAPQEGSQSAFASIFEAKIVEHGLDPSSQLSLAANFFITQDRLELSFLSPKTPTPEEVYLRREIFPKVVGELAVVEDIDITYLDARATIVGHAGLKSAMLTPQELLDKLRGSHRLQFGFLETPLDRASNRQQTRHFSGPTIG